MPGSFASAMMRSHKESLVASQNLSSNRKPFAASDVTSGAVINTRSVARAQLSMSGENLALVAFTTRVFGTNL